MKQLIITENDYYEKYFLVLFTLKINIYNITIVIKLCLIW